MTGGRDARALDEQLAARLAAMGVPQDLIEKQCAKRIDYELWPENDWIVRVFCAMAATQWHVVAHMAGLSWIGLRYEALPVVVDALRVPDEARGDLLWGVQQMERAACRLLNQPQAQASRGRLH
jgi:hypothetical protein